ncbi:caspase-6-like isoform X2 [Cheilinus undulatus]|uniref:caspase-6-like isoform X2 n=1 Tax=Cheilinus undulatus TaxID=241271 RepID=UPI001BD696A7|nr:caspase-6-like isoform X2 [Cheilinus undulatus]
MADGKSGGSVATDSIPVTNRDAGMKNFSETVTVTSSSQGPREEYKMDHKRRGLALIFNQENFESLESRPGTQADRDNLEKSLKDLNFEVKIYNDKKKSDVEEKIREAANADHSNADGFVLVFLSHGEKDHLFTYDKKISIKDITSPFKGDKCKSLIGKPKIYILQASRGGIADDPVVSPCGGDEPDTVANKCAIYTLPAGADFIMCYSVAEGYREADGSWYIQALCEMLQKHGTSLEFTNLLTLVNRMVSKRSANCNNKDLKGKKQIPCFASMLTKQLYLKPKK